MKIEKQSLKNGWEEGINGGLQFIVDRLTKMLHYKPAEVTINVFDLIKN